MNILNIFKKPTKVDIFKENLKNYEYTFGDIYDIIMAYYFYFFENELTETFFFNDKYDMLKRYNNVINKYDINNECRSLKISALLKDVMDKYGFDDETIAIKQDNKLISDFEFQSEKKDIISKPDEIFTSLITINIPICENADIIAVPYKDVIKFESIQFIDEIYELRYWNGNLDMTGYFKDRHEFYKQHSPHDKCAYKMSFIHNKFKFTINDCDIYDINTDYAVPYDCVSIDYDESENVME